MRPFLSSSLVNFLSFAGGVVCFCGFFVLVIFTFTDSYLAVPPAEVPVAATPKPKPEKPKRYVPPAEVELPIF